MYTIKTVSMSGVV